MTALDLLKDLLAAAHHLTYLDLLAILFLAGLLEVILPPLPGDAVFLAGGFILGQRAFPLTWAVGSACLGTFLAAGGLFVLGRTCGRRLLRRAFFARLLPLEQRARVEGWFARYGLWAVAGSRFIPVVRSGIALGAGMAGVRPIPGLLSLAAGIVVFNTFLIAAGNAAGDRWPVLAGRLRELGWVVPSLLLCVLVLRAIARRRAR